MINVTKEKKGEALVIRLAGSIEENLDFEKLIGPTPHELFVNCKEISRINSEGVKTWIKYFQDAKNRGTEVTFQECSVAIVEQINLISNFVCGGEVESIFAPFACTNCKAEFVSLFKTEDLKKASLNLPEMKCPKCGGKVMFDDIPEEYFDFLTRD